MSQSTLQLTQFAVQKLRCIGGEAGRASPYRITTYRGMKLGTVGLVAQYGWEAVNAPRFEARLPAACRRVWRTVSGRPGPD
jgi:hypothetical protein